jgi:sec-independent protein translocase protein TatB
MFSWSEILLIAVVALIFIGPKELPAVLHKMGQAANKVRRSAEEFRRHFDDAMREAGYQDIHKSVNDLRSLNPTSQLRTVLDNAITQNYAPVSPPAGAQPTTPPSIASAGEAAAPAVMAASPAQLNGDASAAVSREGPEAAAAPSKNHAATIV